MHEITRYHDISVGHTLHEHEGKCAHLHGHEYRIHFTCEAVEKQLDAVGRVIDFGVIKAKLCMWLEEHWDHHFLVYTKDPRLPALRAIDPTHVVSVPFNPTAENMAMFLVEMVGPTQLRGTGVRLVRVQVDETRKCSAIYEH